jgi:hypothetical protein
MITFVITYDPNDHSLIHRQNQSHYVQHCSCCCHRPCCHTLHATITPSIHDRECMVGLEDVLGILLCRDNCKYIEQLSMSIQSRYDLAEIFLLHEHD